MRFIKNNIIFNKKFYILKSKNIQIFFINIKLNKVI